MIPLILFLFPKISQFGRESAFFLVIIFGKLLRACFIVPGLAKLKIVRVRSVLNDVSVPFASCPPPPQIGDILSIIRAKLSWATLWSQIPASWATHGLTKSTVRRRLILHSVKQRRLRCRPLRYRGSCLITLYDNCATRKEVSVTINKIVREYL